jgi:hypothetical protein
VDHERRVCALNGNVYYNDQWCSAWDEELPFCDPPVEEE